MVDQCPRRDTLLTLGDFNASTATDRDGYEMCVGHHGSGTVNQNNTKFLDFARSHGLRVAGSWFQRPQAHRWTLYSNAGGVAKWIDHVLLDGRWRMIQNCRVYRSAQFLNNDHSLVVVTLKLQGRSISSVPIFQRNFDISSQISLFFCASVCILGKTCQFSDLGAHFSAPPPPNLGAPG